MTDVEHSEVQGYSMSTPKCAACSAALVDVVRDDAGRIMSWCPNRDK
jgi:hypothetical protein